MSKSDPQKTAQLARLKQELAQLKAEKLALFPPNPHPLAQPDTYPKNATPEQIQKRNLLVARIEQLEKQIEELGG